MGKSLWGRFISGFSAYELVAIGLIAALGIAAKNVVGPLAHMVSVPAGIPGGALAGGFYMLWLVLARSFTGRRGAAALAALIQAIVVLISGSFGSHGLLTLITYTLPGVSCEIAMILHSSGADGRLFWCVIGGMAANLTGVAASNLAFFRLPAIAFLLMAVTAAFSGALGGAAAHAVSERLKTALGR